MKIETIRDEIYLLDKTIRSLKGWHFFLTYTPEVKGAITGDTWVYLASPKKMGNSIELIKRGIDPTKPKEVKGKVIISAPFKKSNLIDKVSPLEFMMILHYAIPTKWGTMESIAGDFGLVKHDLISDYDLFEVNREYVLLKADYYSNHIHGGYRGLEKNILEFVRHSDITRI